MILDYLNKIFNNREIALISYLLIFIFWTLTQTKIRKSMTGVIKAFLAWKILVSIFILMLYVALIVYGLSKIRLWDTSMIKDTIYWTFGVGFIIMMNFDKALKDKDYFKNLVKENLKLLVIIEFIVGLYVFGLITEFIIMPFVILFSILLGYTEVYKEYKQVQNFLYAIFSILGIMYLLYSGYHIYLDFTNFASFVNFKTFIFPIIMSFLFLPFGYTFALLIHYESLFVRLGFSLKGNKNLRKYAKWRILISVNFSLLRLKRITPGFLFGGCLTKDDIIEEIRKKLKPSG